jgi:hypothetical protein
MSAGPFKLSKYQTNSQTIHPIKIQEETEELVIDGVTNSPPALNYGPGAQWVRVSGGTRQLGIHPRKIGVRFTGDVPDGYAEGQTYYIPVLTEAAFNDYTITTGLTGTYLGEAVVVVGNSPERKR